MLYSFCSADGRWMQSWRLSVCRRRASTGGQLILNTKGLSKPRCPFKGIHAFSGQKLLLTWSTLFTRTIHFTLMRLLNGLHLSTTNPCHAALYSALYPP